MKVHDKLFIGGEWSKARDDMRAWFRVAELSFDNYLAQAARR